MPHLLLMRHAEADQIDGADRTRPLTRRGRLESALMGAHLGELVATGIAMPGHVWISNARRTGETWDAMRPHLAGAAEATPTAGLYSGDEDAALAILARTPPGTATAVLVGHNPVMEDLLTALVPGASRRFVPGTQALVALPADWPEVMRGCGSLAAFATPAGLLGRG